MKYDPDMIDQVAHVLWIEQPKGFGHDADCFFHTWDEIWHSFSLTFSERDATFDGEAFKEACFTGCRYNAKANST